MRKMAMVRQVTEVEQMNGTAPEEIEQSSDQADNHSESHSPSGSKRNTPVSMPSLQYSKEELMKFSTLPLSKSRPSYLDVAFNNISGKWDPERWFMGHRGDRASSGDDGRLKRERIDDSLGSQKRKSSDPKERIKEEKDDIVLSPQRRSFGTGCHVVQPSSLARRPSSPLDSDSFRDSSRRIGSGRIMARERDQRDWDRDRDYGYGSTRTDRRDRFDQDDDKDLRRFPNRYNRNDRRSRGRDRIDEVEPEWFSGGPTSQSETIELVGFEDSQSENRKQNKKNKKNKQNSRRSSLKSDEGENIETSSSAEEPPSKKENTAPEDQNSNPPQEEKIPENKSEPAESDPKSNSGFDLDDLFRMDWIPGLLQNEVPPESGGSENSGLGGSRFSKWFKHESPKPGSQNNSPRSSLHEELISNVLNSITEPSLIPSPVPRTSDTYFAPISPVRSHSMNFPMSQPQGSSNKDIMSILHTASAQSDAINGSKQTDSKSVKDLEADLKRIVLGENNNKVTQEKSAFDKLLQHMSESRDSPASSISIGPLDKSKALQEQDLLQDIMGNSQAVPSGVQPPQAFKEEKHVPQHPPGFTPNQFAHLQPNQNELFAQLMQQPHSKQQEIPMPHMPPLQSQVQHQQQNQPQQVHGLTVDMLAKVFGTPHPQLSPLSPGLQNAAGPSMNQGDSINSAVLQYRQQQEILSSILKQQQQAASLQRRQRPSTKEIPIQQTLGLPTLGVSPRQSPLPPEAVNSAISSQGRIPSPLVFGQQPPALSHAPAPIHPAALVQAMSQPAATNSNTLQVQNPVVLQRVPSPQELAVHTQSILQNALIKRKLEEQKENYRKRQEAQRAISPAGANKNGASISPLKGLSPTIAFTPTSVMRKIQSEKSENKEQKTLQNGSKMPENKLEPPCSIVKMNATSMDSGITTVSSSSVIPCSSNSGSVGQAVPRALHGQTSSQPRPIHGSLNSVGGPMIQNQGRPIVKVGMSQNLNSGGDLSRIGFNKTGLNPKQFISSSGQALNVHEADPGFDAMSKLNWQHQLMRQSQTAPPVSGLQMAATYAALNRPPAINPHHPNLRPVNMSSSTAPNMNFPLLRNTAQNTMRAPPNAVNQINNLAAALQLQQRATLDSRQLQALAQSQRFHPTALQQLLLNSQNQVNAAQAQSIAGFPGGRDAKHQHLLPGQPGPNRQSPVNLAKWFGSDVLKQKMPEMPPVPQQKALLVEEIERQQQQSTAVHN